MIKLNFKPRNIRFILLLVISLSGFCFCLDCWTANRCYKKIWTCAIRSIYIDFKTKNNWTFTIEGVYTKTLKDVLYQTINLKDSSAPLSGSGDDRPVYLGSGNQQKIGIGFTNVFLLSNTNEGYRYSITASVGKII